MIFAKISPITSSRRRFLYGVGVGLTAGLAGCTGGTPAVSGDDGSDGDTGEEDASTPTPEPTPTPENASALENASTPDVATAIPTTTESASGGSSGSGGGASSTGGAAAGSWTSNHPDGQIHEVTCDGVVVSAQHIRNYPDRNLRIRERELYLRLILLDESTNRSRLETIGPVPTKSDGSLEEALVSLGDYDIVTADHTTTRVNVLVSLEGGGLTGIGGSHTATVAC